MRTVPGEARYRVRFVHTILVFSTALVSGCQGSAPGTGPTLTSASVEAADWFRDDTIKMGIDFRHEAGPVGSYFMPQIMGSGAAVLDYDNDGRMDLYFVQNGGPGSPARNKLFHQLADGSFEDVSAGSGLDIAGHGMGVAVGDFDNDGLVDVYVSQYGGGRLFHNLGNGKFEDVTQKAGVELLGWGTSTAFFDFDRDGWLDLAVVHYLDYSPAARCGPANGIRDYCHPSNFPGASLRLFHNRGRDASGRWLGFEDVTVAAGLSKAAPGLGIACADFDGDGWPDILVANDSKANHLWINRHNGTFVDEAVTRGVAYNAMGQPQANMGVALGDVLGHGRWDVFVTHLTEETNTLWQQTGPGAFEDRTAAARLTGPLWHGTGFGTVLADFDLDGVLDLAVANGRVARTRGVPPADTGLDSYWSEYAERNQLFAGKAEGGFTDLSTRNPAFCGFHAVSRGLVWGDFDNDGRLDLVTTSVAGPARFFRNIAEPKGHWLTVRAVDPALKRDAYGAVVTLRSGIKQWVSQINPGQSYLCSGDARAHFGLGQTTALEEVRIAWPDGMQENFKVMNVDQIVKLERGQGLRVGP